MNLLNYSAGVAVRRFSLGAMGMSAVLAGSIALAAPGAHGPNGEHLDGPAQTTGATATPKVEANSELFELVATLHSDELSMLIDRYETNEPVLNAKVEVESGPHKAPAVFHADHGDYAVADPAFLKALAVKGEHALVFTVTAGSDSDLLDATLINSGATGPRRAHNHSHATGHGHSHGNDRPGSLTRAGWIGAGVVGLGMIGMVAWLRQRKLETAAREEGGQP